MNPVPGSFTLPGVILLLQMMIKKPSVITGKHIKLHPGSGEQTISWPIFTFQVDIRPGP